MQRADAVGAGAVLAVALEVARRDGDVSDAARTMLRQVGLPRWSELMGAIESLDGDTGVNAVQAQVLLRALAHHRVWR